MQVTFSSTRFEDITRPYVRSKLNVTEAHNSSASFVESTSNFISKGRALVESGVRKFKLGIDSEASADLELGAYYLYTIATIDEIENNFGKVIPVENTPSVLNLKEELHKESSRYFPIIDVIYGKRLFILMNLFSLEELNAATTDNTALAKLNRSMDELFDYQTKSLTADLNNLGKDIIIGLKVHLLGALYFLKSKNLRLNFGGPNYAGLLKDLNINPNEVPIERYDGGSFDKNITYLKWLLSNLPQANPNSIPLQANTVSDIFRLVNDGNTNIITPAKNIFCERLALNPLNPLAADPVTDAGKLREAATPRVKKLTPYVEWKNRKSTEIFPLTKLTENDISHEIPLIGEKKSDLLLRYYQMLEKGKLPHGESSPKEGRLILSNPDRRTAELLKDFLASSNITPIFLFSPGDSALKKLYFSYKKITFQGSFNFQKLKKSVGDIKNLQKISDYLENCAKVKEFESDKDFPELIKIAPDLRDFFELKRIDPDFGEAVLSNRFLYSLLDYLTKPDEKAYSNNRNDDGASHEGNKNTNGYTNDPPDNIKSHEGNGYAYEPFKPKPIDGNTELTINATEVTPKAHIVKIECPFLDYLELDYKEALPIKGSVQNAYFAKGRSTKDILHDDFHMYNSDSKVHVILTLSNGLQVETDIRRPEADTIIKDINGEKGYSDSIPIELAKSELFIKPAEKT